MSLAQEQQTAHRKRIERMNNGAVLDNGINMKRKLPFLTRGLEAGPAIHEADLLPLLTELAALRRDVETMRGELEHSGALAAIPEPLPPPPPSKPITIALIKETVGEFYKMSPSEIDSPRRDVRLCFARHVAVYLCKTMTTKSFPEIGRRFGNRDHTTILYAIRKISSLRTDNTQVDRQLTELERQIRGEPHDP